VKISRWPAASLCLFVAAELAACFGTRREPEPATPVPTAPPAPPAPTTGTLPPPPDTVPDVVPRAEPRSHYGNPPFYDVFGKRYYVLSSSVGYVERGVASWYGPGFHKVRTSTGEPYDMYAMTAAHTTLPLPTYVRVTNLQNGRSIVVRVNDRGPFVDNRIIDLSYTAAAKLDMLRNGTAIVEVSSIEPPLATPATAAANATATATATFPATIARAAETTAPATTGSPGVGSSAVGLPAAGSNAAGLTVVPTAISKTFFVQAGAFSDPANAQRLAEKLRGGGYGTVFVRDNEIAGRRMFRVRIGPITGVAEFDRIVAALGRSGIRDARLALD
jgi:rare lipoprotein A